MSGPERTRDGPACLHVHALGPAPLRPGVMPSKLMASIERRVYGQGAFQVEESATRSLLKFCVDHNSTDPAVASIRSCLAALELGERSNAVDAYRKVHLGKDGFGDWWPPVVTAGETEEYVTVVFQALVERWRRLMEGLSHGRA